MSSEFYGRKTYFMGRWWVRGSDGTWSVRAWVTRRYNNRDLPAARTGMRGPMTYYGR
jgi:hypothetical protein